MPSAQTMKLRNKINRNNINRQGNVPKSLMKTEEAAAMGPILLGVFLFVVVGSAIFQILNVLSNGNEL
ncbi:unnamed protein product [Paramecium primaurelia]|uniref:Uncharacterized protein n=2 Tax=Paramecium TaxID=5884 RepID=A0A8S1Y0J8_9CILI|nr:unnamed protein product [Paramecium primaurelia]CAD8207439.1 unnamed protein product [Paramecium pentaurelia]